MEVFFAPEVQEVLEQRRTKAPPMGEWSEGDALAWPLRVLSCCEDISKANSRAVTDSGRYERSFFEVYRQDPVFVADLLAAVSRYLEREKTFREKVASVAFQLRFNAKTYELLDPLTWQEVLEVIEQNATPAEQQHLDDKSVTADRLRQKEGYDEVKRRNRILKLWERNFNPRQRVYRVQSIVAIGPNGESEITLADET